MENAMRRAAARQQDAAEAGNVQLVAPLMHWWFLADLVLITIAGAQLFVLTEWTNQFFAWTIALPLTAAFMGAAYWGALPMVWYSSRARLWSNARVAVPGVWLFTLLTLIATVLHFDKFHWNSPLLTAQVAFWTWLVIYIAVPIGLAAAWFVQRRVPGSESVRAYPMPQWFRVLLGAQAVVLLSAGAALYLFPAAMIPLWMWTLTPLTSMAVGAWCIGIGVTNVWSVWENDWERLRGAMQAYALLGILQLLAVARYAEQIHWNNPLAFLYVAFLASVVALGALGVLYSRRAD